MRDPWPPGRHEDDRLSAFLDDELSDHDALEVTRHLSGCDRCLSELEEIRAARAALRGLPNLEPPPSLLDGEAVAARAAHTDAGLTRLRAAALVVLVLGAMLSVGAFAVGGADDGTVVPPVDVYVVDHVTRVGGGPMITPVTLDR